MNRNLILMAAVFIGITAGTAEPTPQEAYIALYSPMAVSEMYRSGVPASITLAQGLLESQSGASPLATKGNNHFGIKCSNWKGKTMKHDDDRKNECFRVYDSVEESYRDHSDFLRYRDRYKFLFENELTDYQGWAYGLKKAGYATDPEYPQKLIRLIEDYRLYDFDTMTLAEAENAGTAAGRKAAAQDRRRRTSRVNRRRTERTVTAAYGEETAEEIPESPLRLEEAEAYTSRKGESFHFSLARKVYSRNGVPFIYSLDGETIASIAQAHDLFVRELLKFNDMKNEEPLAPGTVVYLQPKRPQSVRGLDKYIVDHDGESLRDIAQRFAVKLEALEKMNGITGQTGLREGDMILLRLDRSDNS